MPLFIPQIHGSDNRIFYPAGGGAMKRKGAGFIPAPLVVIPSRSKLLYEGLGNRVDGPAVYGVADNGTGKVDTDPAGNNQDPSYDRLADCGVNLAQVETDDEPQCDVEDYNEEE